MHFWKHLQGKTYPNFDNKVLWMVFVCNLRGWTFLDKYPAPVYESSGVAVRLC